MGKVAGKHQGAHYFTVGQRKGLNVGGTTDPLFIIGTNVETNTIIYVASILVCFDLLCLLKIRSTLDSSRYDIKRRRI
jgi:tRNA U34 2-thiouridine synthase MnmA/TrmU